MSFTKNGVKLAGVVLSGTLVLGAAVPVCADAPVENTAETADLQTKEEKTEKVVFLNTREESDQEAEKGPFDERAVGSFEEAVKQLIPEKEEDEKKEEAEAEKEENNEILILVLCGDSALSEEESGLAEEAGIRVMKDTEYEELLKKREEERKAAEKATEEKNEAEPPVMPALGLNETEEEAPPFIWQAPVVIFPEAAEIPAEENTVPEVGIGAEASGEIEKPEENQMSGILLPGFSAPVMETADQEEPEETAGEESEDVNEEADPARETDSSEEAEPEEEEEVYALFAMFLGEEAGEPVMFSLEEPEEIEEVEEEKPVLYALPGIDLVGNGTTGVGGGSGTQKPSTPEASSKPASPSGTTGSSGNSVSNTTPVAPAPATPSAQTTPAPSAAGGNKVIKTGDASHGIFWGMTAGLSGAMAAFFASLRRKMIKE